MTEQDPSFKRNKILDMLQEDSEQPEIKTPATSLTKVNEQFIYPYIGELDQLLHRFKERHFVPESGTPAADNF